MHNLRYVNNMNEVIDFNSISVVMDLAEIFSHEWQEETLYNKIISFKKKTNTYSVPIFLKGSDAYSKAEKILNIIEKDIISKTPGMLQYGDWYLPGYFTSKKTMGFYKCSNSIRLTLGFVTDAEKWCREYKYTYRINDVAIEERGLGYAYSYPYDFLSSINTQNAYNYSDVESDFILQIYGPAINPEVTVGENIYKVDTELYRNEHLVINTKKKTIIRTTSKGEKINEYAKRSLENYIFQKIPSGMSIVTVTPNCNFDIVVIEERSEPQWI